MWVCCRSDGRGAGLYLGLATLLTQLNRNHELAVLSYCQHIVGERTIRNHDEYSLFPLHFVMVSDVLSGMFYL